MPTLLQINILINSGSTGRIAEEIGKLAIKKGWKSYIAYGRNDAQSQSQKIKVGGKLSILWHVLLSRLFDLQGFGSYFATKRLVKEIKRIKPNIIHLHNIHGYYLNIKVLFDFLSSTAIPIVWTLHDCWSFIGHGSHFDREKSKKGTRYFTSSKAEYPQSWFFDNSYWHYLQKKKLFTKKKDLTLVPVSKWLSDLIKTSFFSTYSIHRIHNGVDIAVFTPKDASSTQKKYSFERKFVMLGVASVWTKQKGLNDFIKLSQQLEQDEMIVLVGVTEEIIKILPANILGIKRTENIEELVRIYNSSDLVLNLSIQESFGLTTVEGFACGVPGIVYNCTASPELISSDTGFVVEQGDFKQLREAINTIKSNGKDFYSKKCRERAERFYNKNERFQEYIDLYNKKLNVIKKNERED